jgi:agmatine deiminase
MAVEYRMPAEWEPHEGTWLAWPHEPTDWPGKFEPIPHLYCEIVRILGRRERVIVLAARTSHKAIRSLLKTAHAWNDNIVLVSAATNRSWTRDYCPMVVRGPGRHRMAVKFLFNGWAKYPNCVQDDRAGELAAKAVPLRATLPQWMDRRVVLEGGSIDVNGSGMLLTTEECLLSKVQQRNPGLTREQYEALFEGFLGVEKTVWLGRGIAGDDTHGHVDDIARFVGTKAVVAAVEDNREDANHTPLTENLAILRAAKLKTVELPMPRPVWFDRQRLPASYANFYIANGVVLMPTFHDPNDRIALNILAKVFPDREVIGIHAVDLVLGLGTLHCGTMQLPA